MSHSADEHSRFPRSGRPRQREYHASANNSEPRKRGRIGSRFETTRPAQGLKTQCAGCGQVGHDLWLCPLAVKAFQNEGRSQRRAKLHRSLAAAIKLSMASETKTFIPRTSRRLSRNEIVAEQNTIPLTVRTQLFEQSIRLVTEQSPDSLSKRLRFWLAEYHRKKANISQLSLQDYRQAISQVYIVYHIPSGHIYVGQTTQSLNDRMMGHFVRRPAQGCTTLARFFALNPRPLEFIVLPVWRPKQNQTIFELEKVERKFIHSFRAQLNSVGAQKVGKNRPRPPPRHREPKDTNRHIDVENQPDSRGQSLLQRIREMSKNTASSFIAQLNEKNILAAFYALPMTKDEHDKRLEKLLGEAAHKRLSISRWLVTLSTRFLDRDHLQEVLRTPAVLKEWPLSSERLRDLHIQYRGVRTLGSHAYNFADTATSTNSAPTMCGCHLLPDCVKRYDHVYDEAINFLQQLHDSRAPALRGLFVVSRSTS